MVVVPLKQTLSDSEMENAMSKSGSEQLDWVGLVVYEGLVVGFEVVEFVGIVVVEVVGVVVVVGSMCLSVEIIL